MTVDRAQGPLFNVDLSRLEALAKPEISPPRVVLIFMCPMAKDQMTNRCAPPCKSQIVFEALVPLVLRIVGASLNCPELKEIT